MSQLHLVNSLSKSKMLNASLVGGLLFSPMVEPGLLKLMVYLPFRFFSNKIVTKVFENYILR